MSPAIQVRSQKRRKDEAQEAEVFIFMHFSLSLSTSDWKLFIKKLVRDAIDENVLNC